MLQDTAGCNIVLVDEAAFHDTAVHEGIWYRTEPYASRKKDVVPAITNVLEKNNVPMKSDDFLERFSPLQKIVPY